MSAAPARLCAVLVSLFLVTAQLVSVSPAHADETLCPRFTSNLMHRVNPRTDANLLTRSPGEARSAAARYGYTVNNGTLAKVARGNAPGLTAIWRLYKSGDFVWAPDGGEAESFVAKGYQRQFINFYAATRSRSCLAPVYRLTRNGKNRMAMDDQRAALIRDGWTNQRVAFYAAASPDQAAARPWDTKFSIAVIPDTQNEVVSAKDQRFSNRATWLAANKSAHDLRFALQVGDLVNWGSVAPAQFAKVSKEIRPLEAAMPWAGAVGNHDTAAVCRGGSACPGASARVTVRDTKAYNAAFPPARFPRLGGTFEPGKIDNSYQTFDAGGVHWLVLSMELWPRRTAVQWARSVVSAHPKHNVIVVTHSYLTAGGSISNSNGGYGATSPRYLFHNLIKVYPNIKFVFSGHTGSSAWRTDVGVQGNRIASVLQTFHSRTNPVRLVEIDTARGTATSRVYAPGSNTSYPSYSTSSTGLDFVR